MNIDRRGIFAFNADDERRGYCMSDDLQEKATSHAYSMVFLTDVSVHPSCRF